MSSEKEKYDGFRPYFKEGEEGPETPELKEISLMPSTIETIDMALNDWLTEELNIFYNRNEIITNLCRTLLKVWDESEEDK